MTIEEAITALGDRNNLLWGMSEEEKKYYSEALDVAIKALEQAPKARTARCNGCRFYEDCKREMESEELI